MRLMDWRLMWLPDLAFRVAPRCGVWCDSGIGIWYSSVIWCLLRVMARFLALLMDWCMAYGLAFGAAHGLTCGVVHGLLLDAAY